MIVHFSLRQMGLLMLAVLPTILAQECDLDTTCPGELCCKGDGQCSTRDAMSVSVGGDAQDPCECISGALSSVGECECTADEQCLGDTCCMGNGECSTRGMMSVPLGGDAEDQCECESGALSDVGECLCTADDQCPGSCCMMDGECSSRLTMSVPAGEDADDQCECESGALSDVGECECTSNDQCPDASCCMADGECSSRDAMSVLVGGDADDQCECESGALSDVGECECTADEHCPDNSCCMMDGECSSRAPMSVLAGGDAEDQCECASGALGDVGECECLTNADCDGAQICCPATNTCEDEPADGTLGACGDPHITGFYGQKFDFTGKDGSWYALIADPPSMHVNMRITAPVPGLPVVTYITGISVIVTDAEGFDHSIVISVKDPHSMDSVCPTGVSPCLADGSLSVVVDGEEALSAPGNVVLAPGVEVTAVNIPGECRSFGFETYWERKQLESEQANRRLVETQDIGEWVLADPTATNMVECTEYVARTMTQNGGLFGHQSEHASFKIVTPATVIRLSHGRLHQLAMRDPTDQFDLPDHLTWQMNVAIDHADVGADAKGILGETVLPTRDANGDIIMQGMESIRGTQEDYTVEGPLGVVFALDSYHRFSTS